MSIQNRESFIDRLRAAAIWQQATGWPQRKTDLAIAARIRENYLHQGLSGSNLSSAVHDELLHCLAGLGINQRATLCELIVRGYGLR